MYKQCYRKTQPVGHPGVVPAVHLGPKKPTTARPTKKGEKGEAQKAAHKKAPASGESRKYVFYRVNFFKKRFVLTIFHLLFSDYIPLADLFRVAEELEESKKRKRSKK